MPTETDSNVYIDCIGMRGGACKRRFNRSKNNKVKFQHEQANLKQGYFNQFFNKCKYIYKHSTLLLFYHVFFI